MNSGSVEEPGFAAKSALVSVDPATGRVLGYYGGEVAHCEIDRGLATAGGIAVDDNGDVYVATNRPDDAGNPGARAV